MNKKLLLLALPAFMVLSGCGARGFEQPEERPEAAMSETTVAQEVDAEQLVMSAPYRAPMASDFVKVGYQIQYSDNGDEDDTISIRFVAALKGEVNAAYWHRGLSQKNGYEGADVGGGNWKYKFSDNTSHPSTVFYTALNNGNVREVAGEGEYADYSCFAIYTLMNIPYETYKDSYLAAYVELTGAENTIKSQGIAVKIERNGTASKNRFYFDPDTTGHFLEGTINGDLRNGSNNSTNSLLRANEDAGSAYWAKYSDLSLKTTDSFGSFYYSISEDPKDRHFQFFGKNSFFGDSSELLQASESLSEYNAPKHNGTYSLFVQNDTGSANHVSTYEVGADQTFSITDLPDWVAGGVKVFVGYADSSNAWHWDLASVSGTSGTFTAPNNILRFLLVRCPTSTTEPNWSATDNNPGRIYNKTQDYQVTMGYYIYGCNSWPDYYPN